MSHNLNGILGPDDVIAGIAQRWLREPVRLSQGISLFPLTHDLIESIEELVDKGSTREFSEFELLSSSIAQVISQSSFDSWIVYFETEYFGGTGQQSSAVWENGQLVYGPASSSSSWDAKNANHVVDNGWPINEALHRVGVWTDGKSDEFEMLGLGQYRSTDDFHAA